MEITTMPNEFIGDVLGGFGVFSKLPNDEQYWINYLTNSKYIFQISHDGQFIGVFEIRAVHTTSDGQFLPEIHCYFLPEMRKYSILALKAIKEFITMESDFDGILTTVLPNTPHVVRVLKMIGFIDLMTTNEDGLYCLVLQIKRN